MHFKTLLLSAVAVLLLPMSLAAAPVAAPNPSELERLTQGDVLDGFKVTALYLNDADKPMGARFVHRKSGFTLDLLRIESVPQGFTWVNTFPVSDQGEPHTQEHLLVGKGATGRAFAGLDTMWLAQSNAFTAQWRTCYDFNTAAGSDVFFKLLDAQLNALLRPDYTDEEIRREVRNFGVTEGAAADGTATLRLEEKGSVYNEMVSSVGNPFEQLYRTSGQLVYGSHHPFSYNSGGEPSGIRTMQPSDIRRFHDDNYYLANMGSILALPPNVSLHETLNRLDAMLDRLQGTTPTRPAKSVDAQAKPEAAAAGTTSIATYPNKNAQQPSPIGFVWPATRTLDANEKLLLDLFMANFAGDSSTNLYKTFIDSKTRTMDIGARSIGAEVAAEPGHSVFIYFTDVNAANLTKEKLAEIRKVVMAQIAHVASLPDDSPELAEFNTRLAGRVVELHRDLSKFVNSPPGFGARNTGSEWMDHLLALEKTGEFRRSVTMKPELAYVTQLLGTHKNFWRDDLAKWQITGVEPYAVAAKADPDMIARDEAERVARSNAEAERLAKQYGVTDPQEAIKRYRGEYDAESTKIDAAAKLVAPPRFVDTPPMTLDDQLQYRTAKLAHDVPLVASTFENMTSATTGLALRLDGLAPDELRYLSLLPALLTRVGVIENGRPVSYDEMSDRLRNEILSLNATFSTNPRTGRAELVVRGAGNDVAEAKRSIAWMRLVLEHPDWRVENLPRLRDAVDQSLSQLRNTMQGSEESWVQNPAEAYRRQDSTLLLTTSSFLTRSHNALRLRWMLKEVSPMDRDEMAAYLVSLSGAVAQGATRTDLKALIAISATADISKGNSSIPAQMQFYIQAYQRLGPASKVLAADALRDLDLTLAEIPDSSLLQDWPELCREMRDDLLLPPGEVLSRLDKVRQHILRAGNARLFLVGATATQKELEAPINEMIAALDPAPVSRPMVKKRNVVEARLRDRQAIADTAPVFVGLLAPNMNGGVVLTSVPGPSYDDAADRQAQLDYLSSRLYAGYGAHGIFLKTISAGLAYSNGLRASIGGGRMGYYAERTPELPQTIKFVIGELKNAPRDPSLADYTVAQAFGEFRSGQTYEQRAEAIAADLADGQTPDEVRQFRKSILELRKDSKLGDQLFDRKDKVYSEVLPGYDASWKPTAGGIYFVIGPDKQLDAYEQYLHTFGGADARLVRLYPRDFWMVY